MHLEKMLLLHYCKDQNPEMCWDLLLYLVAYHRYSKKDTIFLDSKLDNCVWYILKLDTYFVSFPTLLLIYSSFPSIQHSHYWFYPSLNPHDPERITDVIYQLFQVDNIVLKQFPMNENTIFLNYMKYGN